MLAACAFAADSRADTSIGIWQFEVDGGVALLELFTPDPTLGASDPLSALTGTFTPTSGPAEAVTMLFPPGTQFAGDEGAPTDNLWLNASPLAEPHLDAAGFAFGYGPTPTAYDDEYHVFYSAAGGEYRGCWGRGGCTTIRVSAIPEPAGWALMLAGFGLAGAALRRRRPAAVAAA
jgi:hypothetical protein